MRLWTAALCGLLLAAPVYAQDAGECITLAEAGTRAEQAGDVIVASRPGPDGLHLLVRRGDGTFKHLLATPTEMPATPETVMVCHIEDYIGDPRNPGAVL